MLTVNLIILAFPIVGRWWKNVIDSDTFFLLAWKFHIDCQEMAQLHSLDKIVDKGEGPRLRNPSVVLGNIVCLAVKLHFKAGISWSLLEVHFKFSPYATEMKWSYLIPVLSSVFCPLLDRCIFVVSGFALKHRAKFNQIWHFNKVRKKKKKVWKKNRHFLTLIQQHLNTIVKRAL